MKIGKIAFVLTVANLVLLSIIIIQGNKAEAQPSPTPVLRAQKIELVEANGRVRGSLEVVDGGEAILRLRDSSGAVRVKLGGATDGSGLILFDDSTEPGVHVIARRRGTSEKPTTTSMRLRGADGRERVIMP